eukprot:NODE_42_length_34079_cov_0.552619.p16 type:complete len:161 gc:universal NODE_42_length_34079_cov_0.552619:12529-12047(-)
MRLSDDNKVTIQRMKDLDLKWSDIAYVVNKFIDCCRHYYYRWKRDKDLPNKIIITNRVLDGHHGLQIKNMLLEDPLLTLRQIAALLEFKVAHKTVSRYLDRNGYNAVAASRQIQIREINKAKRRDVAEKLFFKEEIWYSDIIWSDEISIKLWPKNKNMMI